MLIVDSAIPFPRAKEVMLWRGQASFATTLSYISKEGLVNAVGVSHNSLNKYFNQVIDPKAPKVSKSIEEKIHKYLLNWFFTLTARQSEPAEKWLHINASQEGLFHVFTLWGISVSNGHPTSYLTCVLCELFEEELAVLNNIDVASTSHIDSLITENELAIDLDAKMSGLVRRIDCAFYLMAAQHAELCDSIPPEFGFSSDLFIELYKTPYEFGVLQERYFETIRDLTPKKQFSALRVRADDGQVVRANEYHESSSKRQINAWKNRDSKSTASVENIARLFEHSVGIQRRDGDIEIYTEGHRFMTIMRRILNQLEKETNIEYANLMLDRYQTYFRHHQKRLGLWEPSSPFLNQSD